MLNSKLSFYIYCIIRIKYNPQYFPRLDLIIFLEGSTPCDKKLMNYYKDIIYGRMRYTAETEINYCLLRQNISLDISYPSGTSFTTYCNGSSAKASVSNLYFTQRV